MDYQELVDKNKLLEEENKRLLDELTKIKEHLKKYTAPTRHKKYYETHKDEILEKMKQKPPTQTNYDKEKIKEKNKRAYLKRKEKNELININNSNVKE